VSDEKVLPMGLDGMLANVSKVKLKGGVVGKVSVVLIVVSLSMAVIAWSVKVPWISAAALGAVFVLSLTMLWRLISFADKNPQAALLEGAEFLRHEELKLGMKGQPQLPPGDDAEAAPLAIALGDPSVALPDRSPRELTDGDD
jgi:hypothetical protein